MTIPREVHPYARPWVWVQSAVQPALDAASATSHLDDWEYHSAMALLLESLSHPLPSDRLLAQLHRESAYVARLRLLGARP